MLVRENATAPGQFICPSSDDMKNNDPDPLLFYDFAGPKECSYGIQVPYGTMGRPSGDRDPAMPLAADKGPWGMVVEQGGTFPNPTTISLTDANGPDEWRKYNSSNHGQQGDGEGQNVLFADYHCEFAKRPIVGIGNDNIYLSWPSAVPTVAQTMQMRTFTARQQWAPFGDTDSFIYP